MKQRFLLKTWLLLCALIVGSGIAWGETVTFTAGTDTSNSSSLTKDGITISVTDGTFSRDDNYRCYKSNTMTVSSTVGNITSVSFICSGASNGPSKFELKSGSAGSYSYNGLTGTWTGDAESFALYASGAQVRMTSITVTYTPAAPAYAITAQSNNNSYGTVSLTGTTITATPNSGYRVVSGDGGYTVTSGTATVTNNGDNTFSVSASTDCTVQINFEAIPTYTVTFADGGSVTQAIGGASVTLPSRDAVDNYTFAGWSVTNVSEETTTAPTIIPAGSYTPESNITLYPVYTRTIDGGDPTPVTVSKSIAEIASANNWAEGKHLSISLDSYITLTASGSTNTGKYFSSDDSWRFYSSESATLTVTSTSGDLQSVTLTYSEGAFTYNSKAITSGTAVAVSGSSAVFNCTTKAFVNSISVTYLGGPSSTTYYFSNPVVAAVATPVITPGANPFNFSTTATITCATDGATIYYSYDNENWNAYTAALNITATTTVYAKATKNEETSNIASLVITKEKVTPTVTVSGELTLDLNGETNVNAGTLTAAVTYNEEAVEGAAVTWSSSDTDVATINASTGAVTLLTTGDVTFTATYAGNDDYNEATDTKVVAVVNSKVPGASGNPYTVAQARAAIDAGTGTTDVYATGIVSEIVTAYNSQYGNISYNISADGLTTSGQLQSYRGKSYNGENFTSADDIQVGDVVVIYGDLIKYGDIYEFAADNQLVSLHRKALSSIALSGTYTTIFHQGDAFSHDGMVVTATYDDESEKDVTEDAVFSGYDMSTLGEQTVTVSYTENEVEKTTSYNITIIAPAVLQSIALSGEYQTVFSVGDEFTHDGLVVTATYDDESHKVVTESAIFSTPDMSTAGVKTITVTYTEDEVEKTTSYDITVNTVAVTGITLDKTSATINAGENLVLTPTFTPANATNQNITWTSSDESVATVANGTVTGVAAGTATITAKTEDGNFTATCEVTVVLGATANFNNTNFGVSTGSNSSEQEYIVSNVTFTAWPSSSASSKTYYDTNHVRFYADNHLKVDAPEGISITKIVFTSGGTWNGSITASTGTYTSNTKTWTGSAESVQFDFAAQNRIASAEVTLVDTRHTLTITAPTNGTISVVDANSNEITTGTKVKANAVLTVTATPAAGYAFTTWTGDGFADATAASTTFTMPASDATIGATFEEDNTEYTITLDPATNGTLTSDKASAQSGETVTLTVTPDEGYVLKTLTVLDGSANEVAVDNFTFTMPSSDVEVEAVFAKKYTISIDAENGTVVPDVEWAIAGQTVTLTITPNIGYELCDIEVAYGSPSTTVELTGEDDTRTFTMPEADVTVTALFAAAANTINLGTTAIVITDMSAAGDYDKTGETAITLKDANENGYTFNGHYVMYNSQSLQFRRSEGYIAAYVNSQMGYTLSITTDASSHYTTVTVGGETVESNEAEASTTLTYTINATSGLLKILEGSDNTTLVTNITLTPKSDTFTIAEACTDGEGKYYGTYSNSTYAFVVPADLTVSEVTIGNTGTLVVTPYTTGEIVPANTGVLVSATTAGEKSVVLTTAAGTSVLGEDNMLKASGAGIDAAGMAAAAPDCKYYRLTMHDGTDLGFWWGAAEGAAFEVAANKAYLAVPVALAREGFSFSEDTTTGISGVEAMPYDNATVYDLQGRRVNKVQKGLYIVNGKKVVMK